MRVMAAVLALLLSACAPKSEILTGSGVKAPAPIGYLEHCQREKAAGREAPECQR